MNITVKSIKVLKTGTNDYGEWKLVKVVTDEDVEYSTLAKEADIIGEGVTINISNMDENAKGQKSFKKFEFVHGAEASQGTPPQQEQVDKALGEARTQLSPPAPQAVGMITKEIGDMIRAKYLTAIFGDETQKELLKWYRSQTLSITRISFDESKLPKFE